MYSNKMQGCRLEEGGTCSISHVSSVTYYPPLKILYSMYMTLPSTLHVHARAKTMLMSCYCVSSANHGSNESYHCCNSATADEAVIWERS